jgi:putative methionine-R-sulfoxide reductase with GAF domain
MTNQRFFETTITVMAGLALIQQAVRARGKAAFHDSVEEELHLATDASTYAAIVIPAMDRQASSVGTHHTQS